MASPDRSETITLDTAANLVGPFGQYQFKLGLTLNLMWSASSFLVPGLAFMEKTPTFKCRDHEDSAWESCDEAQACDSNFYFFDGDKNESIIGYYQLYCDRHYLIGLIGSAFFVGQLIGVFLHSRIADIHGRKGIVIACNVAVLLVLSIMFLQDSYESFLMMLINSGVAKGGLSVVCVILFAEQLGPQYRHYAGTIFNTIFGFNQIVLAIFAYYTRSWRAIILLAFLPPALGMMLYQFIEESPRFLVSVKKNYSKARRVYRKIAETNNREMFSSRLIGEGDPNDSFGSKLRAVMPRDDSQSRKYSTVDLFRYASTRGKIIFSMLLWFTCALTYFGLMFQLPNLSDDPDAIYENGIIMGVGETIGVFSAGIFADKFGRRSVLTGSLVSSGMACLVFLFSDEKFFTLIGIAVGKCLISGAFCVAFVYTPELFPTVVRSTAIGLASWFGRIGGLLAPLLVALAFDFDTNPMWFFAICAILMGLLTTFLPETKGAVLPEEIEEHLHSAEVI